MVNITLIELHADDGTFSANLPFNGLSDDDEVTVDADGDDEVTFDADSDDAGSSKGKGLAVFGVFLFLVAAAVVVKKLTGEDEQPDVDVDTEDVPSVDIATSE